MGKEKGPNRNIQNAWKGGNSLSIREEENYWSVFWEFQGIIFVAFHFCLELTLNTSICLPITRSSVVVLLLCLVTYMLFPSWNDHVCRAESLQACVTLCNPMGYSPPGSSVRGISRQEYWSGLQCSPGDVPDLGIELRPLMSPALAGGFFTTSATWKDVKGPWSIIIHVNYEAFEIF